VASMASLVQATPTLVRSSTTPVDRRCGLVAAATRRNSDWLSRAFDSRQMKELVASKRADGIPAAAPEEIGGRDKKAVAAGDPTGRSRLEVV